MYYTTTAIKPADQRTAKRASQGSCVAHRLLHVHEQHREGDGDDEEQRRQPRAVYGLLDQSVRVSVVDRPRHVSDPVEHAEEEGQRAEVCGGVVKSRVYVCLRSGCQVPNSAKFSQTSTGRKKR